MKTWREVGKALAVVPHAVTEWIRIEQTEPDRWRDVLDAQRLCQMAALDEDRTDKVIGAAFNRQMINGGRWRDNVVAEIKAEVRNHER